MFTSGWYLTLFTNFDTLGPHVVNSVLLLFLADGWKVIHRTALAVLGAMEARLLACDFEELMTAMQCV